MGRVVAQHPAATMEEHEDRQRALDPSGPDDGQVDLLAIRVDGLLAHVSLGQFQLHAGLGTGQHRAGVLGRQGFQGFAAACGQGFEEGLGGVLDAWAARGEGVADGQGEQAAGDESADRFHGVFLNLNWFDI
ncbi:hypothetical protein D9M68_340460 [compost metagenome]